jgi:hypothetical protein
LNTFYELRTEGGSTSLKSLLVVVGRWGVRLGLHEGLTLVKIRSNIHDRPLGHALFQFAGAKNSSISLIWVKSVTSL